MASDNKTFAKTPSEPQRGGLLAPVQMDAGDRVAELASQLYLQRILSDRSLTKTHHAEEAFKEAEAFWAFADARANNKAEK